jgi:hypothetical protein
MTALEPVSNGTYLLRGAMAWTLLPAVALFNGILANTILLPALGEIRTGYVSALVLLILFVAFVVIVGPRMGRPANLLMGLAVGLLWVVFNVAWEFLFVGALKGVPVAQIARGFDLTTVLQGNLYPLLQIAVALGPWVFLNIGSSTARRT